MSEENVITLADGTVINMATGKPVRPDTAQLPSGYVAVPSAGEAVQAMTRVRRKLSDLPDTPDKMNIIGCVAAYHLFGLEDWEIAMAIGCTDQQVGNIRMSDAFGKMIEALGQSLIDGQQEGVREMIAAHASDAVNAVVRGLSSDNEQTAIVAAKDILDRAGHRPADVVEHKHKVEGGLTIEYVKKDNSQAMPTLELNAEDVTDANR